jgi:adenylosuccinate lyase
MERTLPKPLKPEGIILNSKDLAAGRYGSYDMAMIWGPEKTFEFSLYVQAEATKILSQLYPNLISHIEAEEISSKANLKNIDAERIRELEEETKHDIIAINKALEEVLSKDAGAHINKARTSADTTQSAKALQIKQSLQVVADSVENLRDILIEKSVEWIDIPHIDTSHLYDALPTVAGRAFAHYAEMLDSDLKFLKFVYENSIVGKWADATGNHHSAIALGINGIDLQKVYCDKIGVKYMIAPAQIPGLEFESDIFYVLARIGETLNNIAKYIALGRSDDLDIFVNSDPQKRKGSSAMPHKDAKNGNPTTEEQVMSLRNYLIGNLTTSLINCEMPYTRNLAASANSRINFEDGFKFIDHGIRNLAKTLYWIQIKEDECIRRVNRSYGVVTSQQVMTFLTDKNKTSNPMTRSQAHNLIAGLATEAWNTKASFINVLLKNDEVIGRIDEKILREITDPCKYIGQSKEIILKVKELCYKKKMLVNSENEEESYTNAGVNVDENDLANSLVKKVIPITFNDRVLTGMEGLFSAGYRLDRTKGNYIGQRLISISNELDLDINIKNALKEIKSINGTPLFMTDYIASGKMKAIENVMLVFKIISSVRKVDGDFIPLIGGEFAEMPGVIKADDYEIVVVITYQTNEYRDGLVNLSRFSGDILTTSIDSVGTKTKLGLQLNLLDNLFLDMIGHSIGDISVQSAEPLGVSMYVGHSYDFNHSLSEIYNDSIKSSGLTNMDFILHPKEIYLEGQFDIVGSIVGIVDENNLLIGRGINEGDYLIGWKCFGANTNGYSLIRRLGYDGKLNYSEILPGTSLTVGSALLEAHENFKPAIDNAKLIFGSNLKGAAHITGGGIKSNTIRLIPKHLDVSIESLPENPVFSYIQNKGKISEKEMNNTFNRGIGIVFVVDKNYKGQIPQDKYHLIGKVVGKNNSAPAK